MAQKRGRRYEAAVKSYQTVFRDALPHGLVVGVTLPIEPGVPEEVIARLHPDERVHLGGLLGLRQVTFAGGRIAARGALQALGRPVGAILPDERGAPMVPPGIGLSISHKATLAIALACRVEDQTVGVDLEDLLPARPGIEERVLRPEEQSAILEQPPERRWTSTLLRFSIKESIYKALAPRLGRYIDFHEAEVWPRADGVAEVKLHLVSGSPPVSLDARFCWLPEAVITSVRARWS
jgi:enterobactin synthetase component D